MSPGFDLVGAEDRPNDIGFYADLLVAFQETCVELGLEIPFTFHAEETLLDTGGSSLPEKSNLYDALLLNAKRISHGICSAQASGTCREIQEAGHLY